MSVLALMGPAGCTSGPPAPSASSAPAVSVTPTSQSPAPLDPEAEVARALAAYRGMWSAYVDASNSGATASPTLAAAAAGGALSILRRGLADNHAHGYVSRGQPTIGAPKVTMISPATAPTSIGISGCVDGTHWLLYTRDGRPADSSPGGRRAVTARIDKLDGTWKVTVLAVREVGTC